MIWSCTSHVHVYMVHKDIFHVMYIDTMFCQYIQHFYLYFNSVFEFCDYVLYLVSCLLRLLY